MAKKKITQTMKQLFLWTVILSSTVVHAQDTTAVKERRFFIGVNFSPDYCYRYLAKNDNSISSDSWKRIKNSEDSIYQPMFGYTTGINFNYQLKKHFGIETGIQYSRKGYKTIPIRIIYDFNNDPEIATNFIYYNYIDIPLRASFSFLKNKFQILTSLGTTLNYLLQVNGKTIPKTPTATFQTQTYTSKYPYNKINISPRISVGLKYQINDRINLLTEPTFRYGLLNTDSKSFESTHLWTAGLNISFNIGL